MRSIRKKWIIAGAAAVTMLGVLTGCTKTTEKTDDTEAAEELPQAESADGRETPQPEDADGSKAQAAEDRSAQNTEDSGGAADAGEETELSGRIEEVPEDSDDSFIIAKLVAEEINGVDIIGDDPDGTKITVVYSMDTRFVKRTVRDGGENVEEAEGSSADLKKDFTVEIKGSYSDEEQNVFFATDVKIVEVVL